MKTLGPGWARGEQMLACGSCPILPGEGRSVETGGVSWTASRVITLIDTSPHTYTPSPGANQKAAFESRGQAWHRCCLPLYYGRNCSGDICLRVFLAQTRILWSPLSLQVLLRTAFLWNHQGHCALRRGAGCCPTQIMRGHMTASVKMATLRDPCVCVRARVLWWDCPSVTFFHTLCCNNHAWANN